MVQPICATTTPYRGGGVERSTGQVGFRSGAKWGAVGTGISPS